METIRDEDLDGMLNGLERAAASAGRTMKGTVLPETVYESLKLAGAIVGRATRRMAAAPMEVEWSVCAQLVVKGTARVPRVLKDLPDVARSLGSRRGGVAADRLFESIPTSVKLSEKTIREFLKRHDVSHITSVGNDPTKAGDPGNVIFEKASINRARGSRNTTPGELKAARFDNLKTGLVHGVRNFAGATARGALSGALMELPITCAENVLHVRKGRKSWKAGATDAAKDVGRSALWGGAAAASLTGLSLLGVTLGPVAVPLAITGGAAFLWSAKQRIWQALDEDMQRKLIESRSVLFLASVVRCEDGRDCVSALKMLPE